MKKNIIERLLKTSEGRQSLSEAISDKIKLALRNKKLMQSEIPKDTIDSYKKELKDYVILRIKKRIER